MKVLVLNVGVPQRHPRVWPCLSHKCAPVLLTTGSSDFLGHFRTVCPFPSRAVCFPWWASRFPSKHCAVLLSNLGSPQGYTVVTQSFPPVPLLSWTMFSPDCHSLFVWLPSTPELPKSTDTCLLRWVDLLYSNKLQKPCFTCILGFSDFLRWCPSVIQRWHFTLVLLISLFRPLDI